MMKKIIEVNLSTAILFIPLILATCGIPSFMEKSPLRWEVGQWVRYETNASPTSIEFSLVGMENPDEKERFFWLEIHEDFLENPMILKLLVREGMMEKPKKIFLQNGRGPIAEVTEIELFLEEIWKERNSPLVKREGKRESLIFSKGTLETLYYEGESEVGRVRFWIHENIPIWGIAKVATDEVELIVKEFGRTGAVSRMREVETVVQNLTPE